MTTATPTAAPTARTRRRGPVARTVAHVGGVNLFLLAWFWAVVVPVAVLGTVVLARLNGEVDAAVVLYARHGAIWFPFSQAIIMLATQLRVHVATGRTRRTFVRASLVVAAGTGLAYALVLTLLAAVERAAHTAAGWGWRITDPMLADESSPAGLLLAELTVCFVAANVAGLLVGIVYHRVRGWWGTLALPLTVGPLLVVMGLLGGFTDAAPAGRGSWAAAAPALLASLAVVTVAAAAYAAVARRIPLRPPVA